jgi:hypothetical protein
MKSERVSRIYLCVTLEFIIFRDNSCVNDIYITQHSTIKKWFSCEFWNKWELIWNEFEITAHLTLKKKKQKLRMFVSETKIVYIQMFNEIFDECKKTSLIYLFNNKICAASSFVIRQIRERHIIFWFIVSFSFMYETCQLDYIRSLSNHLMKNHSSYNSSTDVVIDITSDVMSFSEFTSTISDVKKNHRDLRW